MTIFPFPNARPASSWDRRLPPDPNWFDWVILERSWLQILEQKLPKYLVTFRIDFFSFLLQTGASNQFNKSCRWLDSNSGPLASEATSLSPVPQTLPSNWWNFVCQPQSWLRVQAVFVTKDIRIFYSRIKEKESLEMVIRKIKFGNILKKGSASTYKRKKVWALSIFQKQTFYVHNYSHNWCNFHK